MHWGAPSSPDPSWTSAALAAQHVLGYNEAVNSGQANTIPSIAASAWLSYVQPLAGRVSIGGPAITNAGNGALPYTGLGWLDSFLADCVGCEITSCPSTGTPMTRQPISKPIFKMHTADQAANRYGLPNSCCRIARKTRLPG